MRDGALYHSVLAAIAAGNTGRGGIASHVGRKSNELSHPLTVLEDAGLIVRENDAFDLYQSRLSVTAIKARHDEGELVPGLKLSQTTEIKTSKLKKD